MTSPCVIAHDKRGTEIAFRASGLALSGVKVRAVYAAGRKSFEAEIPNATTPDHALAIIFDVLHLAQCGWDRKLANARLVHGDVWRVNRYPTIVLERAR